MIRLFHSGVTSFNDNGIGSLNEAVSCIIKHEINGEYELEMTYPIHGRHYDDIQHRRIIYVEPDRYSSPQPFRIYAISRPMNGMITVNARHVCYDLSNYYVSTFKAESISDLPKRIADNYVLAYTRLDTSLGKPDDWATNPGEKYAIRRSVSGKGGFEYRPVLKDVDWDPSRKIAVKFMSIPFNFVFEVPEYILLLEDPGDMAQNFKNYYIRTFNQLTQEWEYTKLTKAAEFAYNTYYERPKIEVEKPMSIKEVFGSGKGLLLERFTGEWDYDGWTCTFKEQLGKDNGVYISYGKNMLDLKVDENSAAMAEFIYPYYFTNDGLVELDDKILYVPTATTSQADTYYAILPVDLTKLFDKKPTVGQLRNMALSWIEHNNPALPEITNTVSIVSITDSPEYAKFIEAENIQLGDTIHLRHSLYSLNKTVRCMSIEYDAVSQKYKSINLETNKRDLADTIAANEVVDANKGNVFDMIGFDGTLGSHLRLTKGDDGTFNGIEITQKKNDDDDVDSGWSIKLGTGGLTYRSVSSSTATDPLTGDDVVTDVVPTEETLLGVESEVTP